MKFKLLRLLVLAKEYGNTERGERKIVNTLTALTVMLFLSILLLIVG